MTSEKTDAEPVKSGTDEEERTGLSWWLNEIRELVVSVALFLPIWLVFTTFVFELRTIPSESMVPALQTGDRVAVAKFAYGYTRNSPAFGIGRFFIGEDDEDPEDGVLRRAPERGDVIVFKHPNDNKTMIKRLIGLPGDSVQMIDGRLILNGEPVERDVVRRFQRVPTPKKGSRPQVERVTEYRETLPGGKSYLVHDVRPGAGLDNTALFIVPQGHVFMMGDNRDNSEDSRAPSGHPELAAQFSNGFLGGRRLVLCPWII